MTHRAERLDLAFKALADPTRRRIVERLVRSETTVGDLAEPFDVTLAAISKHIAVLERAGIAERWRDGRVHRVRLNARALEAPSAWLTATRADWDLRLDRLEALLKEKKGGKRA